LSFAVPSHAEGCEFESRRPLLSPNHFRKHNGQKIRMRSPKEGSVMKGSDIKVYRKKLGMTQEELTKRFGVAGNTIARWERDEYIPDAPGMLELAFLGLEVERGIDPDGEIAEIRQRVTKRLGALRASSNIK
jgi:DNA-binding XRE family transcriptional regulator